MEVVSSSKRLYKDRYATIATEMKRKSENFVLPRIGLNILMDHEDEFARKGNFARVFPLAANVDYYEKFFEVKRYNNNLLWSYIRGCPGSQNVIQKHFKRVYTSTVWHFLIN